MVEDFLREFLSSSDWQRIQNLWRGAIRAPISWTVNSYGKSVQKPGRDYPELCRLIRKSPVGLKLCRNSHSALFQEVMRTGKPAVSACFCGAVGFAMPFILDNEIIGVAGGCFYQEELSISAEKYAGLSTECGIDLKSIIECARKTEHIPIIEKEQLLNTLSIFAGMLSLMMKWMTRLFLTLNLENQYAAKVSALSEIGIFAASELNWDEMLTTIASKTRSLLDVDACSIYVLDQNQQELVMSAADGLPFNVVGLRIRIGDGITGQAAQTRSAVVFEDTTHHPGAKTLRVTTESGAMLPDYRSILSMPLIAQDRLIGVIDVHALQPKAWTQIDFDFLSIIAVHVSGIIEKSKFRMEVTRELEVARYIQERLLPESPPVIDGYDLAALAIPNREISGDYYDFIPMDEGKLGIIVADVCGKGIGAAMLMANTQGVVHAHARSDIDVRNTVFKINNALYESTEIDKFVTMFYGVLNTKTGSLSYTNAGHNYPFVYRNTDHEPQALDIGGLILGLMDNAEYSESEVRLMSGDIVVFYSDGVTEALSAFGDAFGEKRLHEVVHQYMKNKSGLFKAQELLNWIYDAFRNFTSNAPIADDLTIVVLISVS